MNKKLTTGQKVEIAMSGDKSLRELALKYGVHHSTIDAIRKESKALLAPSFTDKKPGRPKDEKIVTQREFDDLHNEFIEMRNKWAIAEMTKDFLAIDHKYTKIRYEAMQQELLAEERERMKKKRRQLKNKKKKRKR
jgi:hypothetical protein